MDFSDVEHLPVAALNYGLWRAMAGERPTPETMQHGAQIVSQLGEAEGRALAAFAMRAWRLVCELAVEAERPGREESARARVRYELPFLDDWTFDEVWIKACRMAWM